MSQSRTEISFTKLFAVEVLGVFTLCGSSLRKPFGSEVLHVSICCRNSAAADNKIIYTLVN